MLTPAADARADESASERINFDFSQKVVIDTNAMEWVGSPCDGVRRKPLSREFAESGQTTSVVSFAPGSSFNPHTHPLGEEIIVLDGVFSDENGDYAAGSYLRNPPGSRHQPFTREGCLLFVKLDQFDPADGRQTVIDTRSAAWLPGQGGLEVMPLHEFEHDLHTAVAFGVLPLFAFANAGISLAGISPAYLFHPVPLGILTGLFVGKQLGVFLFCAAAIKLGIARLPDDAGWAALYGVSVLSGIGFTMSLFIGGLAFENVELDTKMLFDERLGIIVGSLLSAVVAYLVLDRSLPRAPR